MKLEVVDEPNGVTRLVLTGRMDVAGALGVDEQFRAISETKRKIVVDLAGVDFLASLGMRTLVSSAKAVTRERGKIVLLAPQEGVAEALKISGIDTIIPIVRDMGSANAFLG
jgi:anti-anti-sigma factor